MTRIRIHTDHIRQVGQQLVAAGDNLAAVGHELQGAVDGLDALAWSGVSRARAEATADQVRPRSAQLAEEMSALGRALLRAADTFEQRDAEAAHTLAGMAWVDWRGGGPTASPPGPDSPDFDGVRHSEGAAYGPLTGQPFIPGTSDGVDIHPNDVIQGDIGDCYLMAPLGAIALQNPEAIRRMIRSNADGTYTVTLYDRGGFFGTELRPVEVVVPAEFPLRNGAPIFAHPGDTADGQAELWPLLIERAYAQQHHGYDRIVGGYAHQAMEELTGVRSEHYNPDALSLEALADHLAAGHAVTASSLSDHQVRRDDQVLVDFPDAADRNPLYQNNTLAADHEYYVMGVNRETGTVTLGNPWGPSVSYEVTLSWEAFRDSFRRVAVNPINP